jgi:kinesin family protein 18/19
MKQQNKINSGKVNILVTVRCRPLSKKESDLSLVESVKILNGNVVHITDEINANSNNKNKKNQIRDQQFYYDFAFDKNTSQKDVYENSTKFLISNVLNGYNATVFAYGATGSGKTYTMIGTDSNPGIMPRCVIDLFNYINKNLSNSKYEININFFEIYNENIRDLLSNNNNNLEIREEPAKGIVINNITNIEIKNTSTFFENILKGNNNRTTESTNSNETSSRSHAILQINLYHKDLEKNEKFRSKFMLVDLAGSERQNSYLNSNNKNNNTTAAMRQMEGSNINKSLLALGICINALIDKKTSFIPWRNSKLTRILKESLIGNSRIVMISTISPSLFSIDETVNT